MLKWKFRERTSPGNVIMGRQTNQFLQLLGLATMCFIYNTQFCSAFVQPQLDEYFLSPCKEMQLNKWFVFRCWIPLGFAWWYWQRAVKLGREGRQFRESLHSTLSRVENGLEKEPWLQDQCTIKKIRLSPAMETRPGWLLCHWFLRYNAF